MTIDPSKIYDDGYKAGYNAAILMACEWILSTPMYAKQPNQLVDEFKKAMEK